MKKAIGVFLGIVLSAAMSFAQSSGNFSYGNTGTTHCVLNNNGTGTITGAQCQQGSGPACTTNTDCINIIGTTCVNPTGNTGAGVCLVSANSNVGCAGAIQAGIKTNSGSGNVFLIRPSAVIGLLTDISVAKSSLLNIGTSSALAGVDFNVDVKSLSGQPQANVIPAFPVTYASRFVQISTNLFNVLGTLCTDVSASNTVGGVTTAVGCYISFNESTVSAHSFDWIAGAPATDGSGTLASGNYGVTVNWSSSLGNFGISRSLTCVGPVNLTVQQNKVFSFNTPNSF